MAEELAGLGSFDIRALAPSQNATETLLWGIAALFVIGVIVIIIMFIVKILQYKHRIIIRVLANDRKYIVHDKFMVAKDDEGVVWWKLLKRKHMIPVAPSDCIEISEKGRMFVESYYTDEGEYIYNFDKAKIQHFDDMDGAVYVTEKAEKEFFDVDYARWEKAVAAYNTLPNWKKWFKPRPKLPKSPDERGRYVYIRDQNRCIDGFQPFTTKQRLILVNQYKKANAKKKTDMLTLIGQLAPLAALVLIIFGMFIFWGDITEPTLKAQEQNVQMMKAQNEVIDNLDTLINNRQNLQSGGTSAKTGGVAPQ